jgi:ATP-dependent DNA helicase RecG
METQNIEYEESWRDEYLKWICGFANAQGGTLYIGKNDKGEVVGVSDAKRLLEDIPNKVKNTMGIIVDVDLMTEKGKLYIRIETEPCGFPLNYKGDYFIRSGATLQMLQGSALTHFLLKRTGKRPTYCTWTRFMAP